MDRLGLVMLVHASQLGGDLMNAMKNSAAAEALVINVGLNDGPEQDGGATLHFLALEMTTTGKALDIVGTLVKVDAWKPGDVWSWSLTHEQR